MELKEELSHCGRELMDQQGGRQLSNTALEQVPREEVRLAWLDRSFMVGCCYPPPEDSPGTVVGQGRGSTEEYQLWSQAGWVWVLILTSTEAP